MQSTEHCAAIEFSVVDVASKNKYMNGDGDAKNY